MITYVFYCPGCKETHNFNDGWKMSGDMSKPSFQPSILVTSGHFVSTFKQGDNCWCTYKAEHPEEGIPFSCGRCHSYITDGKIQFLNDCTHELAGKTVDVEVKVA